MKNYIRNRFLQLIPILIGMSFLTFALLYISPGDPAQKRLNAQGVAVTNEVLEQTRIEMGLNRPFGRQYVDWLIKLLQGDMGQSYKDGTPVSKKISRAMKNTGILTSSAFLLALVMSLPVGIFSAVRKNRFTDYCIRLICFAGNAIPNFLLAILLIYFLCIRNKIFPVLAKSSVSGLFLPVLALALPLTSRLVRQVRATVLEQLETDYVKGARARGVKEKYILVRNVLPNAMLSIITLTGLAIGTLLGGSVVIESIFRWPGVGKLVMDAITDRDYPVIQGTVILTTFSYVVINLIIDITYQYIDPRTR